MRSGSSRTERSGFASSASPSPAASTKRGFGGHMWTQRPSLHSNRPFGARLSPTQVM